MEQDIITHYGSDVELTSCRGGNTQAVCMTGYLLQRGSYCMKSQHGIMNETTDVIQLTEIHIHRIWISTHKSARMRTGTDHMDWNRSYDVKIISVKTLLKMATLLKVVAKNQLRIGNILSSPTGLTLRTSVLCCSGMMRCIASYAEFGTTPVKWRRKIDEFRMC